MQSGRRVFAVILAVLILIAMASSALYLAAEADHNCVGEDCPICMQMAVCLNTLRTLSFGLVILAGCLALADSAGTGTVFVSRAAAVRTPVLLKVKLLN